MEFIACSNNPETLKEEFPESPYGVVFSPPVIERGEVREEGHYWLHVSEAEANKVKRENVWFEAVR